MHLQSARGALQGGSAIRESFRKNIDYHGENGNNEFHTYIARDFCFQNYTEIAEELTSAIAKDRPRAVQKAFGDAILEIMRNSVEHSGVKVGQVSCVRTSFTATVLIIDHGVGFAQSFQSALKELDKGEFPESTWDDIAIKWATLNESTTNSLSLSENAGIGLPRFINASEHTAIVSGLGRFTFSQVKPNVPNYANAIHKPKPSLGVSHCGVAIEAFFNLRSVDSRIEAYRPNQSEKSDTKEKYGDAATKNIYGRDL